MGVKMKHKTKREPWLVIEARRYVPTKADQVFHAVLGIVFVISLVAVVVAHISGAL